MEWSLDGVTDVFVQGFWRKCGNAAKNASALRCTRHIEIIPRTPRVFVIELPRRASSPRSSSIRSKAQEKDPNSRNHLTLNLYPNSSLCGCLTSLQRKESRDKVFAWMIVIKHSIVTVQLVPKLLDPSLYCLLRSAEDYFKSVFPIPEIFTANFSFDFLVAHKA